MLTRPALSRPVIPTLPHHDIFVQFCSFSSPPPDLVATRSSSSSTPFFGVVIRIPIRASPGLKRLVFFSWSPPTVVLPSTAHITLPSPTCPITPGALLCLHSATVVPSVPFFFDLNGRTAQHSLLSDAPHRCARRSDRPRNSQATTRHGPEPLRCGWVNDDEQRGCKPSHKLYNDQQLRQHSIICYSQATLDTGHPLSRAQGREPCAVWR
jgi:hypothetical protein